MRQILLAMLATTALFGVSEKGRAEVRYNIVPISPKTGIIPSSINDSGVVAGSIQVGGGLKAFYFDGTTHILPTLGGTEARANGINNNGVIIGESKIAGNAYSDAFKYDGSIHDLGNFGGPGSNATGINNSGVIVGNSFSTGPIVSHGFTYDGSLHILGDPATSPWGINDAGMITGGLSNATSDAFIYDGSMHDIGGPGATGRAINSLGQVAGTIGQHALFYDGTMHDLGTFGVGQSLALGINDHSQVVGWSQGNAGGGVTHAFLYDLAHGMVDLNNLIDHTLGWELEDAVAINELGEITGRGTRTIFDPVHGNQVFDTQGFILVPVPTPEPSTLALAAFAFAGLAAWRWQRRKRCQS